MVDGNELGAGTRQGSMSIDFTVYTLNSLIDLWRSSERKNKTHVTINEIINKTEISVQGKTKKL